jgi:hypothetical protein
MVFMPKSSPEKLAAALRANLKRRKAPPDAQGSRNSQVLERHPGQNPSENPSKPPEKTPKNSGWA